MMNALKLAGIAFAGAALAAGGAGAAELKVLSVDAMKPALQQLAPSFEKASKEKVKIDYASAADVEKKINAEEEYDVVIADKKATDEFNKTAKIAGGLVKPLAKKGSDVIEASSTNWTQQPGAAKALIDFLAAPQAAAVYKEKGLQPG
ncbi:MAG TPA: substrate-binding domain-containing protein [Stellaceae bacterium]|nr:substrate-binding domain-containing protein [Stellaceae bacterium]